MASTLAQDLQAILAGTAARKRETAVLDFKEEKTLAKEAWSDLAEAAVCFANAAGGTIVVGVADSPGGREAFKGSVRYGPGVAFPVAKKAPKTPQAKPLESGTNQLF